MAPTRLSPSMLVALAIAAILVTAVTGLLIGIVIADNDGDGGTGGQAGGTGGLVGGTGGTTSTTSPSTTTTPTVPGTSTTTSTAPETTTTVISLPPTTTTIPPDGPANEVVLRDGVVTVPVPEGWESRVSDDGRWSVLSVGGSFAYVEAFRPENTNAAVQVGGAFTSLISEEDTYSQVSSEAVMEWDNDDWAYGTAASVKYTALWTGQNGSFWTCGEVIGMERGDGWVLLLQLEAFGDDAAEACNDYRDAIEEEQGVLLIFRGAVGSFVPQ